MGLNTTLLRKIKETGGVEFERSKITSLLATLDYYQNPVSPEMCDEIDNKMLPFYHCMAYSWRRGLFFLECI